MTSEDDFETYEEVLERHKKEIEDLENDIKKQMGENVESQKQRNKLSQRTRQLRQQLEERHYSELLPYRMEQLLAEQEEAQPNTTQQQKQQQEVHLSKKEQEKAKKRAQNQKKKDQKKRKEQRMRDEVQEELRRDGGLTERQRELIAITNQLVPLKLSIYEIPSDGNCMYRAVCHQLTRSDIQDASSKQIDYQELRRQVAAHMRKNKDDFLPFLETPDGDLMNDEQFENYCQKIESSSEWGGQIELKAITHVLQKPIKIFQNGQPIIMGEEFLTNTANDKALHIAYHRSYYSLGEHYNSIIDTVEDSL